MTALESASSIFFSILFVSGFITRSHLLISSRPPPSVSLLLHREKDSSLLAVGRFVPDISWTQHAVSVLRSCAQLRAPPPPPHIELITSGAATVRAGLSLRGVRALGVDVEFSPKSYQGFVCSVQVSIPGGATDFVFDTLQVGVRHAIGEVLGPIFSDPNIPKVFHGAGSDIRWLSRDLGLSVSGLIDTAVLAHAVGAPPSLAAALSTRLGILLPDKAAGQRRDWSARPLPRSALEYAARDARHLIALAADLTTSALSPETLLRACVKSAVIAASRDDENNNITYAKHQQQSARLQMQTIPGGGHPIALTALTNILASRDSLAQGLDKAVDDIAPVALLTAACMTGIHAALIEQSGHAVRTAISSLSLSDAASTIVVREVLTSISLHAVTAVVKSGLKATALHHFLLHHQPAAAVSAANLRKAAKAARAERVFAPRATPLYSNCELLDPKGRVLARISKTKALWYINNGAGVAEPLGDGGGGGGGGGGIIGEEGGPTLRVKLLVAPRGPGHADDDFHLSPRVNECVVCARPWKRGEGHNNPNNDTTTSGGLLRLYVIPRGVRCELPLSAKSYSSHDVVLVCIACHRRADSAAGSLLRRFAVALGRGVEGGEKGDQIILRTLRSKALAILKGHAPTLRLREYLLHLATPENIAFAQRLKIALDTTAASVLPISTCDVVTKPIPPRGRSHRLPSAATAAAVSAAATFAREENKTLAASWSLLKLDLDIGLLTPDLIVTLARSPNGALGCGDSGEAEQQPTTTDVSAFVVAAVYEGGEAWNRARHVLENGLREKAIPGTSEAIISSSSLRGASGLLLTTEARLEILVRRFRQTFVEACVPRSLPTFWSIDFPVFNAGTRTKEKKEAPLAIAALKAGL